MRRNMREKFAASLKLRQLAISACGSVVEIVLPHQSARFGVLRVDANRRAMQTRSRHGYITNLLTCQGAAVRIGFVNDSRGNRRLDTDFFRHPGTPKILSDQIDINRQLVGRRRSVARPVLHRVPGIEADKEGGRSRIFNPPKFNSAQAYWQNLT